MIIPETSVASIAYKLRVEKHHGDKVLAFSLICKNLSSQLAPLELEIAARSIFISYMSITTSSYIDNNSLLRLSTL